MKKQQIKTAISAAILGVMSPLAMAIPASAATVTWNGLGDRGFDSGLNWQAGGILANGDTAVFPASANVTTANNDMPSLSLVKILFNGESTVPTSSKSFTINGNALTITEGIEAVMTGLGGTHAVNTSVTLGGNATFKTTGANTLSVGGTETTLALGTNNLTLDASGGSISLLGKITGSGNIVKSGAGKAMIATTPGTGGYSGTLTVPAGEINATGTLGNVSLTGGTLKGAGTVGSLTMSSGSVSPGNSPGVINTGNIAYTGGSFDVELGGKAAGQFDQTSVTGTVKLGTETTLNISLVNSYTPAVNDSFVIVNNDAEDAVEGTFKGLADGSKTTLGAYTYQINYDGGTGNDVVLLVTGTPSAPDTGVGSIISSPLATLIAAMAVAGSVAGYRFYELKKARR